MASENMNDFEDQTPMFVPKEKDKQNDELDGTKETTVNSVRDDLKDNKEKPSVVDVTLGCDTRDVPCGHMEYLKPSCIEFNKDNAFLYDEYDPENKVLEVSIKNSGVVVAVIARRIDGRLILLSGERRLRIAQKLGLSTVPVWVVECDDCTAATIMLESNRHREHVTAADMIRLFCLEIKAHRDDTDEYETELQQKYDIGIRTVQRRLELADGLPKEIINQIGKGLSYNSAKRVLDKINAGELDVEKLLKCLDGLDNALTPEDVDLLVKNGYDISKINVGKVKEKMYVTRFTRNEMIEICGNVVTSKDLKNHILKYFRKNTDKE